MKINLNNITGSFNLFIKSIPDIKQPTLISFAFRLNSSDKFSVITQLNELFDDIFLFQTVSDQVTLIGLNSTINLQPVNARKFSEVIDNYNYWKKNFINNWPAKNKTNTPLIFCTTKFDPTNYSSMWNDYEPLRIYVPELIFSFVNNYIIGYYNFTIDKDRMTDSHLNKLNSYLKSFVELKTNSSIPSEVMTYSQSIVEHKNIKNWDEITSEAFRRIEIGEISKLVLSRTYTLNLSSKLNWKILLRNLNERFPDCYLFFIKKNNSIFFGSSPEMFLKVSNKIAEVESVAGSAARGEQTESDNELENNLKMSAKNHQEHLFVSDFITNILLTYSDDVRVIEEKQIRKLENIQHLITRISAELNSTENLFELIDALFPTPAVCGIPKEKAIELIRKIENYDRGLYSGLIGMIDFECNCEIAVAIRSALVKENNLTAFAGAGLLNGSDPKEEFLETELKLNTILSLFFDENKS